MNGKLCISCKYRTQIAGNGPEFQYCNYPDTSGIPIDDSKYIFYMSEDECPLKQQEPQEGREE